MMPILIVDDSKEDADLASRILWQCKIRNPIEVLNSGKGCLDWFEAKSSRRDTSPCLVLLDLSMKPESGIDVLRHFAQTGNTKARQSMFVMLSGISDYNIVREGYLLGAVTFLVKPLRCDDVLHMVKAVRGLNVRSVSDGHVLEMTELARGSERGAEPEVSNSTANPLRAN
jgi:CheY-like chemotaxis protein